MPRVEYPLVATTMTEKQTRHFMAPAINQALNSSGMMKNFPRAVVYGPDEFQGLGIHNPFITQGVEHIKALINEIDAGTDTGDLIRATLEQLHLELGTGRGLSEDSRLLDAWRNLRLGFGTSGRFFTPTGCRSPNTSQLSEFAARTTDFSCRILLQMDGRRNYRRSIVVAISCK